MLCPYCSKEFCYVCGRLWKVCLGNMQACPPDFDDSEDDYSDGGDGEHGD